MRRIAVAFCPVAALVLIVGFWMLFRHLRRGRDRTIQDDLLERTRAEHELPDALLQNFQGVLLKFHAAAALVATHPTRARRKLDDALAQADETIAEARDALDNLRVPAQDLTDDLRQLGTKLGADPTDENAPVLRLNVRGTRRALSPLAKEEVHRIAREAIRTGFDAIRADHIEVDIHYGARRFELVVRARRSGRHPAAPDKTHADRYGLPGLREQIRLAGGQLTIRNCAGAATEVELSIPASIAYGPT